MRRRSKSPQLRPAGDLHAVVTDIDGTLTDRERRLDPQAVETLQELVRSGVLVVLATGNVLPIALGLYRSLGLNGPIVAENGGLLYQPRPEGDKVTRLADQSVALAAYRHLLRAGIPVRRLFTDRWRETEVGLVADVDVRRIRSALRDDPVLVESTGYAIHLMEKGAGKKPALDRALKDYGVGLSDCLALGDGDNDVPVLEAAGFSVSFPTGSAAARAAADLVTRAKYGRGFVEGVKRSPVVRPLARRPRNIHARR